MLTWAFFWAAVKSETINPLGWIIPMLCDVAIFYFIAVSLRGW